MKKNFILMILIAAFFAFGCDLANKSQTASNDTSNLEAATPTPANSKKPEATPTPVNSADRKNLLALGNGSFAVLKSSEYSGNWRATSLVDELAKVGWASAREKTSNQSVTIELTAKTTLKSIVFDTAQVDEDGTAAKEVTVEISDTSATEGFQEILTATLKDKQDGQEFPVKQTVGGRWLRLNVKNNYGSPNFIEVMEMRGYGEQETPATLENISGTYESSYGNFHIKQEGTSIVGCYEFNGGLLEGGLENRLMKLTWKENGDSKGPALMFFAQDGKQFLGVWAHNNSNDGFSGEWNGKKISEKVGSCEHLKTLEAGNAAGNKIEESLEKTGRAIVYGINFDFNSDVIKNESKPTLDQIAAVLTENKQWKMTVEGHTDNVGGETANKTLSEKRANAVKTYLVGKGIEAVRLSASGMGMSKPVAQNETEAGRAQNRRVELVKQ